MKSLVLLLAISFAAVAGSFAESPEPLLVEAPKNWSIEFNGEKGLQFYTVKGPNSAGFDLLMFSRWPPGGKREDIPNMVSDMAKRFLATAKTTPALQDKIGETKMEEIKGDSFSGQAASFALPGGMLQTTFMVSDGDGIWNGQFTGTSDGWKAAVGILQKLKRKP